MGVVKRPFPPPFPYYLLFVIMDTRLDSHTPVFDKLPTGTSFSYKFIGGVSGIQRVGIMYFTDNPSLRIYTYDTNVGAFVTCHTLSVTPTKLLVGVTSATTFMLMVNSGINSEFHRMSYGNRSDVTGLTDRPLITNENVQSI